MDSNEAIKESLRSHERIAQVMREERDRLADLYIASKTEFYMKTALGRTPDEVERGLRLTLRERLQRFFA